MNDQQKPVHGPRDEDTIQEILALLDPYIEEQAKWVASLCAILHKSIIDWEDLAQAARIHIWTYFQQHPDTSLSFLFTVSRLRMYGEPQRGRSVDRAHPGKRKKRYTRAALSEADDIGVELLDALSPLTDEEEETFLRDALSRVRQTFDEHGEHLLLLALRRFAKATSRDELYREASQQLRAWWKHQRETQGSRSASENVH